MKPNNILMIAGLSLFIQLNLFAEGFRMTEEANVNDIPFNTSEIYYDLMMNDTSNLFLPHLEEENPVNDIPFDTERIATIHLSKLAESKKFSMIEETEVPDIPFNTRAIANKHKQPQSFTSSRLLILIGCIH